MKPNQVNYLIITITVCLAFLSWGTIIVLRRTVDANYHAPAPLTATQQRIKDYETCSASRYTKDDNCSKIVNGK